MHDINDLSFKIRGAMFEVHSHLGPGLLESVYESALIREFSYIGLRTSAQVAVPAIYKGEKLDIGFRMDILVENKIIIEVKSVEFLHDVHKKQLLTYLKLADKKLGLLVNFNAVRLKEKESLIRIINGQV